MMEFRLLGDIEAFTDGQAVDIGYLQRRCILAMLLTEPNRVVRRNLSDLLPPWRELIVDELSPPWWTPTPGAAG